jgi:hypothetical protein
MISFYFWYRAQAVRLLHLKLRGGKSMWIRRVAGLTLLKLAPDVSWQQYWKGSEINRHSSCEVKFTEWILEPSFLTA